MEQGQMQKYQEISKLYKEIVDSITTLELPQLKLYLVNLDKRIQSKAEPLLAQYQSVKQLFDNTKEAKGKVPLHFACAKGDLSVVQYLIEETKLDYRIKDKDGSNPYFTSIEHGHLNIIQYFIESGKFSANETKDGEISGLHIASNHNHTEVISYLISKGADVEKISIYGRPINWAVGGRNFQATKLLLESGANPEGDNSGTNISPLILAVDHKDHQIYKILVEKGANINTKDPNGYTVLHLAAQKGDIEIVQDLVSKGADINIQAEGKTALYLAFEHGQWQVVSFLKEKIPDYHHIEQKWKIQSEKLQQNKVQPNKQRAEEIKIIGNKYYAAKQYEQALIEYQKAILYDPQNEIIHRNIAACYLALKNYELALFHCKQAKKKDPKNVKTTYREAQAYIGLGNLIDASSSMWECCMIEPLNKNFRNEFSQLVDKAKEQHKSQSKK